MRTAQLRMNRRLRPKNCRFCGESMKHSIRIQLKVGKVSEDVPVCPPCRVAIAKSVFNQECDIVTGV